jgi:hypothetical protein
MFRFPQRPVATAVLLLVGPSAFAQITATGPFTGTIGETWESFSNYTASPNFLPNPTSIFSGAGTISNSSMAVYEPSAMAGFTLGLNGSAQVADGVKAMGIDFPGASSTTITFAGDVSAFGGYWGNYGLNLGGGSIRLTFFDASGNILGSDSFLYNHTANSDGVLDWHGWQFAGAGIRSLSYEGLFVVNDGLQATTQVAAIPEPEIYAMLAVGLGLVGWAGRKRKLRERTAA